MTETAVFVVTWICTLNTILAAELLARRRISGWYISLINQAFWLYVNVYKELWPFLLVNVYFVWVNLRAIRHWREAGDRT